MKCINAGYEILTKINGKEFLQQVEKIARVCYKSEEKITEESSLKFVAGLVRNKHFAMIEHAPSISVKFTVDRGISHEVVRHRLFSFAQESTRYCNYIKGKGVMFILPSWFSHGAKAVLKNQDVPMIFEEFYEKYTPVTTLDNFPDIFDPNEFSWYMAMLNAEYYYNSLVSNGWKPQQARSVLPNSLKTEIVVTGNIREWRHFFTLRTANGVHPQMLEVSRPLCIELKQQIPVLFDDIEWED